MKRFLLGLVLGAVASILLVVGLMATGEPFQSKVVKYGTVDGDTVLATPDFVIIYKGMDIRGGGSFSATLSGHHGTIPAFWRGYGTGGSRGENGLRILHQYEPNSGTAILFFHGRLVLVENSGANLRVQNCVAGLGKTQAVVVVEGERAMLLGEAEASAFLEKLTSWFTNNTVEAAKPPLTEQSGTSSD